jgi:hypothetical protein
MRKILGLFIMAGLLIFGTARAGSDVQAGISITDEGVKSFCLAIGNYYHVPEREVCAVRERRIPDDEMPVVFFIARRAHVEPELVVKLRLDGRSWLEITRNYHLNPDIYYYKVSEVSGPPYGKAYGYFKNHPRSEWREARLDDDDIVNLVNLRFICEHNRYQPQEVFRLRESGNNFVVINSDVQKAKRDHNKSHDKKGKGNNQGDENRGNGGRGNGHGNGRGHDKD